jgi:ABC-type phosphate transport system permease subunit
MLAVIALASAVIISALPGYWQGFNINGIINRSLVSGLLLLAVAVPGTCYALFYLVGVSPKSFDISRYPVLIFFAILGIIAYVLIIGYIVKNGTADLHWSLFTRPFQSQYKIIEEWQNGWPVFSSTEVKQIGMLNHITGTLLLMGLTSLISLPIGVSVGIFVYEYAGPKLGSVINFSTTALRSISGIILAVTALSVLSIPAKGTFLYNLFHGYGYDVNGVLQTGRSSFLFASVFVSLLVIPIIAKATQEGLNSLPADIREGSLAIGASKEHTLFHLQLPWSFPNIITGLMLGCAEAAGTLTIIFLIAGTGEFGVSPTNETTSLAYLIFDGRYGRALGDSVQDMMASYQYTAALSLLIITLGLTATALIMKRNLAKRYKGA